MGKNNLKKIHSKSVKTEMIVTPGCYGKMADMLDKGQFVEKCLNGPCLENGFHQRCQEASMKRGRSHDSD